VDQREVDEGVVVEGDAHEVADELEVDVGLKGLSIEPVELRVLVELEHAVLGVEQFLHYQTKVLLAHATLIDARLTREPDAQGQLEWVLSAQKLHLDNFLE